MYYVRAKVPYRINNQRDVKGKYLCFKPEINQICVSVKLLQNHPHFEKQAHISIKIQTNICSSFWVKRKRSNQYPELMYQNSLFWTTHSLEIGKYIVEWEKK